MFSCRAIFYLYNMNILEKDLEDLIWDCIEEHKLELLADRGLELKEGAKFYRQLNLMSYGIPDIVSISYSSDKDEHSHSVLSVDICIYELKRGVINIKAFNQILSYARAFQLMFNSSDSFLGEFDIIDTNLSLNLIGTSIDRKCNAVYLSDLFENVNLYITEFNLEKGLIFKKMIDFVLVDGCLPIVDSLGLSINKQEH